jgi:hypothetical protein
MENSLNTSLRVLLPLLEELGTARSLTVAIMLRYKDWAGIASLSIDPRHYVNAESYFRDSQATNLLKKVRGQTIPGIDRKKAAFTKWLEGEAQCYKSNERLSKFTIRGSYLTPQDLAISRFFRDVAKTIESWIGPSPPNLDNIKGKFGPGSTFADRGRLTTVPDKMTSVPTLTRASFWYLLPWVQTYWGRSNAPKHGQVSWVRGNRYLTVPKTSLVDRSIAVEPSINVFYQLGLGTSIRRRLNNATGWDLDRAQDVHRAMARDSSRTREFATLDLSNASDTVSMELVRLLLPASWFRELKALRSPFTSVNGKWYKLEKFSSMGNGFTFELETLIFAGLMSVLLTRLGHHGVLGEDVFVFGDDIIIPDDASSSAEAVLNFCGFSVNTEKSFSGSVGFRESCGGDFFEGADVRSFYLKEPTNDPWKLLPDCNGIRKSLKKLGAFTGNSHFSALRPWLATLPADVRRCNGPEELGDIVLHTGEDQWRFKWEHGIRYFRAVIMIQRHTPWSHWHSEVVLASALYGVGDGRLGVLPRDPPISFKVKWVPFS